MGSDKLRFSLFLLLFIGPFVTDGKVLMATLTKLPSGLPFEFVGLDTVTGHTQYIRNWTSLGAGLGGHTFVQASGKTFVTNTLVSSDDNTAVYLFDSTGAVLKKLISTLPMNSIQYVSNQYVVTTIMNRLLVLAAVDFGTGRVTQKFAFAEDMYQQVIGVSAVDQSGVFYVYCASDVTQNNYWLGVSTRTWTITLNHPSSLDEVVAVEVYNNTLVAVTWNDNLMSYDIYVFDIATGSEKKIASLSALYPSTLSGSTVDSDGNFYLAIGTTDNSRWVCATVNLATGAVSYSSFFFQPILSLVALA
jgi:hypothetical protein